MLAWVVGGQTRAGWIVLPARQQTFVTEAGGGVLLNGARISIPSRAADGLPRGAVLLRYMPDNLRGTVTRAARGRYQVIPDSGCAAVDYTDILKGERDFAVYYRLMPWDHAAPALMIAEAGGSVHHVDGAPYSPRSENQLTIVARDADVSRHVRGWFR
jgi:fructose-1,6-bisphosphatase/inositol monophosphatase family enzyme